MRKRIKLTALGLDRLKPPSSGRDEYADTIVPGLTLRVTDKDRRSYSLLYRVRGSGGETKAGLPKRGTLRRLTLRAIELGAARDEARRAIEQADAGKDPAVERLREVLDNREIAANTFGVLAGQFLEEHRKERNRPGAYGASKSTLDRLILPHWRDRPITELTTLDVNRLLRATKALAASPKSKVRRGAPNKVLVEARAVFAFAKREGLITINPTDGVKMPVPEPSRDRVLIETNEEGSLSGADELRRVWEAAGTLGYPFGPFYRLLILTAQRRDEVAAMRWSEIEGLDGDAPVWRIPAERTKAGRAHDVPLSPQTVKLLTELPRFKNCDFVLTTMSARKPRDEHGCLPKPRPISGYSKAKRRLDGVIAKALREEAPETDETLAAWRVHDLRRTAATGIAALGFPPHVVGAVLNHSPGVMHGVTAIYNKHRYGPEKRRALTAWGVHVAAIATGRPAESNVVALAERA